MKYTPIQKAEALTVLTNYGKDLSSNQVANPYFYKLQKKYLIGNKTVVLSDFDTEFILNNYTRIPKLINKVVKIGEWFTKGKVENKEWNVSFNPQKIEITYYLGETETMYLLYFKYKQNMELPIMEFIPKKAIIENFLLDDYHNVQVDFDRYDKLSLSKNPTNPRKLFNHQKEGVQFLLSRKKCILADDMGLGKMEPVSALIPTPNGFKKMGDIKKGDLVFGQNGIECTVIDIFPHKNKEIYKVTFTDGSSMECGLEHLFLVRDKNMLTRKQGWKTKSLNELLQSGLQYNSKSRKNKNLNPVNKWEIPVAEPIEYKEKEYLVHPYILGVCIGDGNMCGSCINISIPDFEKETADRISSLLPDDLYLREDRSTSCPRWGIRNKVKNTPNRYFREIKRLGLNVHGNLKFIPEEYKLGSINQRIELLRGLMDSDGSIRKGNKIGYYTNSEQLAKDVKELVCSLGGVARIHGYEREKNNKKRIEYHVLIQLKINPFYLTRKKEQYNPSFKKYCTRHILSAEYIRNEDAQCIMVDNDSHTYLTTRDYIVTHNTTTLTVAAIEGNYDAVLILCPASLKINWFNELSNYIPEREISIIGGYDGFKKEDYEKLLGYGVGKSGKKLDELRTEAKELGKWRDNRFVIINYNILSDVFEMPQSRKKVDIEHAQANRPILDFIKRGKSLIIIDEAHNFSKMDSLQYKITSKIIKEGQPDSIFLATGTPITNNPKNYFAMLSLLGDPITADWEFFMNRYCGAFKVCKNDADRERKKQISAQFIREAKVASWYDLTDEQKKQLEKRIDSQIRRRIVANGAENLEELRDRTAHLYLRRMKDILDNELPPKYYHEKIYELNLEQQMEYNKLWDEYVIKRTEENPDIVLSEELVGETVYRKYLSNQMVEHTIDLTDRCLAKGEKVVIACCYTEELTTLRNYYGDKCVVLNGEMDANARQVSITRFMTDPTAMVFIGNIRAAGVGITLTSARVLIFNNIEWVPGLNNQMSDRVHRIGQTRDVHIYYQIFKDTQYEEMWKKVLRKDMIINQVIKKEDDK